MSLQSLAQWCLFVKRQDRTLGKEEWPMLTACRLRSQEVRKWRRWVRSIVMGSLEIKWAIWHIGFRGGKDVPGEKHQAKQKSVPCLWDPPAPSPHLYPAPRTVAARHALGRKLENSLENMNCTRVKTYRHWHLRNFQWNGPVCYRITPRWGLPTVTAIYSDCA